MKFTTLFSLAATVAKVQAANIMCNMIDSTGVTDITCENLTQLSVCDDVKVNNCCIAGQEMPTSVQIRSQICNGPEDAHYDKASAKLYLSGPAIVEAGFVPYSTMADYGDGDNCETRQYNATVNRCEKFFTADLVNQDGYLHPNSPVSKSFMKRNCPLDASITCSIGGVPCVDFASDFNLNSRNCAEVGTVNIDYTYCAKADFAEHNVVFRSKFVPNNRPANCNIADNCNKESRVTINRIFAEDPLDADRIGEKLGFSTNRGKEKCFTITTSFNTCDGKIPMSFMNLVGEVKNGSVGGNLVPQDVKLKDEYKACFKSARFDAVDLNPADGTNPGSSPGSSPALKYCDENEPTAAPSAAPSNAPTSAGSKSAKSAKSGKGKGGGKGKKCKPKKRVRSRY